LKSFKFYIAGSSALSSDAEHITTMASAERLDDAPLT
jgi:hypothetical protein